VAWRCIVGFGALLRCVMADFVALIPVARRRRLASSSTALGADQGAGKSMFISILNDGLFRRPIRSLKIWPVLGGGRCHAVRAMNYLQTGSAQGAPGRCDQSKTCSAWASGAGVLRPRPTGADVGPARAIYNPAANNQTISNRSWSCGWPLLDFFNEILNFATMTAARI
jgi:hypothetical protein